MSPDIDDPARTTPGVSVPATRTGPLVLVADNDEDSRTIIEKVLTSRGYQTLFATAGHDALMLARSARPTLIVCELYMRADGHPCVAHAVKRETALRHIPVLAYTSYVLPADLAWAAGAPVDAYVTKPAVTEHLLAEVARLAPPAGGETRQVTS